jgi:ribosomal protein S18 acetylase RimI-like enzyme
MDVDIAPFDLTARLDEAIGLARTAMSAAGQPGGILIGRYLEEVTEVPGLLALGALRQDTLVGMLVGWPVANRWWWRHHVQLALATTENLHWLEDAFELAEFHVHPAVQGLGIGTALLDTADGMIEQRRIVLSTNAIDNRPSREFYRRRGFRTLTPPFRWLGLDLRVYVLGREIPR